MPIRHIFLLICHLLLLLCLSGVSFAAVRVDAQKTPHEVIGELWRYMWCGKGRDCDGRFSFSRFVEEEKKAVSEIRELINNGESDALLERNGLGNTPLMSAASYGYSEVVGELLKSAKVRSEIDAINSKGVSAWLYANMANNQTEWFCNYSLESDRGRFQKTQRYQSYYVQPAENPYKKTRRLLEKAGAKTNLEQAKQHWLSTCKKQNEKTRAKVQGTNDLLATVVAESAELQEDFWKEWRQKTYQCPAEIDTARARELWINAPKTPERFLRELKRFMDDPLMDGFDFGEKIFGFARENWGEPSASCSGGLQSRASISYNPIRRWENSKKILPGEIRPLPTFYRINQGEYGIDAIILNENDELLGTEIVIYNEELFSLSPVLTKEILGQPENINVRQDYLTLFYKIVHGQKVYRVIFLYEGVDKESPPSSDKNKQDFSKIINSHKHFYAYEIQIDAVRNPN